MSRVVVIGAGIGGLTAAALLVKAGAEVTVLEAQTYPGGCAGTFFHKGFRFDAGATLAGGFAPGGPHARLGELLGLAWPVKAVDPAWVVHLPGQRVTQWADPQRWQDERRRAFPGLETFWKRQEGLARASWQVAARNFPWPPQSAKEFGELALALRPELIGAAPFALGTVASLVPSQAGPDFWAFLDAQLIISAQTTARRANALYGSAALDLPRRGVQAVVGGTGGLAQALAGWITGNGGRVLYRQKVERIELKNGRAVGLHTRAGLDLAADQIIANLTPPALNGLLGKPPGLPGVKPGWGAFALHLGLDQAALPPGLVDHHQVICDPVLPPGEGNTVFISFSDPADPGRALAGMRSATLSTHTRADGWFSLLAADPQGYGRRKEAYTEKVLAAAERAVPGIRQAVRLCLAASPVTYQFYTGRPFGLVGGSPQESLLQSRGPRTGLANIWLVGDSIFPGQSTAGVTLGAMRAARRVLERIRQVG